MSDQMLRDFDGPIIGASYDGRTYEHEHDHDRLNAQLRTVYMLMRDGVWRTTDEIAAVTGLKAPSIQARVRDLRKEKFGSYLVESRRREGNVWEWRVGARGAGVPDSQDRRVGLLKNEIEDLMRDVEGLRPTIERMADRHGDNCVHPDDWGARETDRCGRCCARRLLKRMDES